ncbi:MAG: hypothetical protein ABI693_16795 [Bryobacteraceae bacterium]
MKEKELFREIVRIAHDAGGLNDALHRIQSLLATEWGGALLVIRPASTSKVTSFPPVVSSFPESRDFPFRGLYVAPLRSGNETAGTLVACIGTWGAPTDTLRRITNFASQQLIDLARRLALPRLEYAEAF